jgi:class 3 adenylate cyclase
VSVGEVTFENDELLGLAVSEAARLCGAAHPDAILLRGLVRTLAGTALEHPLTCPP